VIVRPHPSESLTFYQKALSFAANIFVRREGNVLNWIRFADVVMHTNCTTGVEAVLAGRPVINFRPSGPERQDVEVACEAGVCVRSVPEVLAKINDFLAGEVPSQAWSNHARRMLNNLSAEAIPLLVKEALAILLENGLESSRVVIPGRNRLREAGRRILKRHHMDEYLASKRELLSCQHVERIIDEYRTRGYGPARIRNVCDSYAILGPE
jgi:hypothetical protein